MIKYHIKLSVQEHTSTTSLVIYAYSEEQLKDMFKEYQIISCTNVDNITEG